MATEAPRPAAELEEEIARLRQELGEARREQAATADVLRAIASSHADLRPVLQDILDAAVRLCDAGEGILQRRQGEFLQPEIASGERTRQALEWVTRTGWPGNPIKPTSIAGRAYLERRSVHVPDVLTAVDDEYPDSKWGLRAMAHRTQLSVPLVRAGEAIGILALYRFEARPFSARQIALLEAFADQAVIAIDNARLFEELERRNADLR